MSERVSDEAGRKKKTSSGHRRRIVIAVVLLAVFAAGGLWAYDKISDRFGSPDDYEGSGSGEVTVQIVDGADGAAIGRALEDEDVVASSEAFYQLSLSDERAQSIQPGSYRMKKKMSADAAMTALVDPENRLAARITIPEGTRVDDIVQTIVENTELPEEDLRAALDDPATVGLPDLAEGNPEGYLFPETYFVEPDATAAQVLAQMVAQTDQVLGEMDVEARAAELGHTPEELMTVASILEWEVNNDADFRKAAGVIYNRLEAGMPLQMDSTVHYVSGRRGDAYTTEEERAADSPYNTYRHPGLPPGPIGSPGAQAIEAALNPEEGDWLYFVADPDTGETTFSDSYEEHQQACADTGIQC